ncbi:alginate O-acetyltransferase [Pseudomonas sp.]|nr:alginate O-acetyltransferase [Pseudomonas sp.]
MGRRRSEIAIPQVPRVVNYLFIDAETEFLNQL